MALALVWFTHAYNHLSYSPTHTHVHTHTHTHTLTAVRSHSKKSTELTFCGTPEYLSPEMILHRKSGAGYDQRVDWWSLGMCMVYVNCMHVRMCVWDN
ncbi:hypothetical protein EON63_23175 [archaeon]|nr:MAG: hypothetical protein EON63_23175 [archaeon]